MSELGTNASAADPGAMTRHFGGHDDLLALWIAEPYVALAPSVVEALERRAAQAWYGYEVRPRTLRDAFWQWMNARHGWDGSRMRTTVSPSIGTSIGVLLDLMTEPGDGVILQPPVFTDFKPLVAAAGRTVIRNPLRLTESGYQMDVDELAETAPQASFMILCNPHNPVGRVWTREELAAVARICAAHDVFVVADEIHADLALPPHQFVPFAAVAEGTGLRWAALHGPIKTFGLAGVSDSYVVTDSEALTERIRAMSSRLHLTRNNVFGTAAAAAAYGSGAEWLDGLLDLIAHNLDALERSLPEPVRLIRPEATYLAWLDLRGLGLDVPELAMWLADSARLALSPGHWFGREGAGFARMTVAVPTETIQEAVERLAHAVELRHEGAPGAGSATADPD